MASKDDIRQNNKETRTSINDVLKSFIYDVKSLNTTLPVVSDLLNKEAGKSIKKLVSFLDKYNIKMNIGNKDKEFVLDVETIHIRELNKW